MAGLMQQYRSTQLFYKVFAVVTAIVLLHTIIKARAADKGVDLVLLLALDVSASVDESEYELVRNGLANALALPETADLVAAGKHGAIGVAVMQWSGFQEQTVKINWIRLTSRRDFVQLANRIRRMSRRYKGGATDIGGAIKKSRELIIAAPFVASRKVIDLAADGTNNVNISPEFERDKTVSSGITINGLAVVGEAFVLVEYFERFIIGGNGAFVEKARDYDSFETAMRRKLLREIDATQLFSMLSIRPAIHQLHAEANRS
jgi:hypothetical protein